MMMRKQLISSCPWYFAGLAHRTPRLMMQTGFLTALIYHQQLAAFQDARILSAPMHSSRRRVEARQLITWCGLSHRGHWSAEIN